MSAQGETRQRRGTLSTVRTAVARCLGVDARALAAFRVALGALLLADLALRARNLTAFYTDAGVLPRSLLAKQYPAFASISVHTLSGAAWVQGVLFAVAVLAALAVLVGYRTKLAVVVSWVLLLSLHARNPLVLNAGDSVLRRLLFWGMFLPMGARWSVDAGGGERDQSVRGRVVSVASAALLVQVVLVYAVNAVLKLRGELWRNGTAVQYVFSLDQFTILLGDAVAQYPAVLSALAHLWLAMLVASPLLLVLRGWWRAAFAGLFAGAHLGMLLTMRLGLFPLISMAALLPFLPAVVWDELAARVPTTVQRTLARARQNLARQLPATGVRFPGDGRVRRTVSRWKRRVVPALAACFLVVALAWTALSVGVVAAPDGVESVADPEERRWDMFAPEPLGVDGWLVVPGEVESGATVDAFHGGEVQWEKPSDVAASYPSARWRKYVVDLWRSDDDALQSAFAGYLCERWDATHEDDLVRVSPHYVAQETRLDGPEPTRRVELGARACTP
jgi:hypothetical protein